MKTLQEFQETAIKGTLYHDPPPDLCTTGHAAEVLGMSRANFHIAPVAGHRPVPVHAGAGLFLLPKYIDILTLVYIDR